MSLNLTNSPWAGKTRKGMSLSIFYGVNLSGARIRTRTDPMTITGVTEKDKTPRRQCKMSSSITITCKGTLRQVFIWLRPSRHQKQFTCKGTLRQVFIWLRPRTPYLTPPSLTYCRDVYSILLHAGVEPERRGEGKLFTRLGRKYQHDWLYLQSLNSDKHLPQSPFTVKFFYDDILTWCLFSKLVHGENTRSEIFLRGTYSRQIIKLHFVLLKVHKNENFFGFDFEFCTISLLVMSQY